ncbi:SDR family NAD(P)-dependent oxidoreductase [Arthrobacter sp. ISL-5]|uniref:SDR family NAD(P)-dependent oxidoreductase n=1 Tax=Arthrobacter sp. ISL-5 TaxID=2819111 RepID=UPI001BE7DC97|nr:SDR family NAD(P)-dependent oxidoreductase [Arthrobacter sp. ISL-5]MBT2555483.1 SDR family NAD(P)-dependent oxidoreductase [Arthrobacter sp. ISL-5]
MTTLTDQTLLITGATDGLGYALARRLAKDGAALVLHGRRPDALERVANDIRRPGVEVSCVLADFAELDQVRAMADELTADGIGIDVLVNNAGVGIGQPDTTTRATTVDGNELRFAVNYLAPALLMSRLLPAMQHRPGSRIVNVASAGQQPIDFDDVMLTHGYSGTRAYCQSKLALITLGFILADRIPARQVTINSLHPGTYMPTKMVLESVGHSIDSLETGVVATARLVADPGLSDTTGAYFNITRRVRANAQAYDSIARRRLIDITESLIGQPIV